MNRFTFVKIAMKLAVATVSMLILASCAAVRDVPFNKVKKDNFLYAADILFSAECELFEAVKAVKSNPDAARFRFKDAVATFKLTVVESKTNGSNVSFIIPLANAGITVGGGLAATGKSTRIMEFKVDFVESEPPENCDAPAKGLQRIESGLGLAEWIGAMVEILLKTDEAPNESTYDVAFQVVEPRNFGVSGRRQFSAIDARSFSFANSASRTTTHRLTLTSDIAPTSNRKPPASAKTREAAQRYLERSPINF